MDEVRTNVMLPADLVQEVDRAVGRRQRGRFLADAARERLARPRFEDAAPQAFGSWSDEDHPDLVTDDDMAAYLSRLRASTSGRVAGRVDRGQKHPGVGRQHLVSAEKGQGPAVGGLAPGRAHRRVNPRPTPADAGRQPPRTARRRQSRPTPSRPWRPR